MSGNNHGNDTLPALSKRISKGDKYFPADFLKRLYLEVDSLRDRTYIMYHAETGLRVSDVLASEWVHVDWQACRTYTYDEKKDQWRYVYWPPFVKAQLKMYLVSTQQNGQAGRLLFPFSDKTANRIIKRWCKRLQFPYASMVGTHWLRHTYVRLSRKAGRDIKAVQANTGDTIKTILEWYSDLSAEDLAAEVRKPLTDY